MLISIFIVFIGFAGLLIVLGRKLPAASGKAYEVSQGDGAVLNSKIGGVAGSRRHNLPFAGLFSKARFSLNRAEIGGTIKRLGEKFMRRAHIGLLKLDNRLLRWLELCSNKSILQESSSARPKNRTYFKSLLAASKNLKIANSAKVENLPRKNNRPRGGAAEYSGTIRNTALESGSRRDSFLRPDLSGLRAGIHPDRSFAARVNARKNKIVTYSEGLAHAGNGDKTSFSLKSQLASSAHEEFWLGILRQNPKNPHPYKRLGEIYMQQGLFSEAEAVFAYALKHNAKDQELVSWMKNIKVRREQK